MSNHAYRGPITAARNILYEVSDTRLKMTVRGETVEDQVRYLKEILANTRKSLDALLLALQKSEEIKAP